VIEEMVKYISDYDISSFYFVDDLFIDNKLWIDKFLYNIKADNIKITWKCGTRHDLISRDMIKKIYDYGCTSIFYGIESANTITLKYMNRTKNPTRYISRAKTIVRESTKFLVTCLNAIVGFPFESKKDMFETYRFMKNLHDSGPNVKYNISILTLIPGTPLWNKYLRGEFDVFKFENNNIRNELKWFFSDKYEHLIWALPEFYGVKNKTMSREDFEKAIVQIKELVKKDRDH
jgi:radical SAM superfamily enzyme YgiQ (UPF0313 family)